MAITIQRKKCLFLVVTVANAQENVVSIWHIKATKAFHQGYLDLSFSPRHGTFAYYHPK